MEGNMELQFTTCWSSSLILYIERRYWCLEGNTQQPVHALTVLLSTLLSVPQVEKWLVGRVSLEVPYL